MKESNMDRWIYITENGRKESGFENLKTRFQDCNLSRKQESKLDGMIERKQSFNRESKLSAKKTSCLCRKETIIPAFELSTWHERKPSVNLYGRNEIKMYHNNSK